MVFGAAITLLVAVAVTAAMASSPAAGKAPCKTDVPVKPKFNYSWDRISTYAFPGHILGATFTDAEVDHFAKFTLLLFWGIDLRPDPARGPGWWVPDQEAKSLAQAAAIKAKNPSIHLFPYIGGFMAETWFKAQWDFTQPDHEAWWLKDPATGTPIDCNDTVANVCYGYSQGAPGKLYDWRIPAVRDYFTNTVIAPYVDNDNISGIFMDDTTDVAQRCMHPPHGQQPCTGSWTFTAWEQRAFVNATMVHLEQALSSMTKRGKTAIISTEVSRDSAPLNASVFDAMLQRHGAMHFNEFFSGSEDDVQTALQITRAGGFFMVHSGGPDTIGPFSDREYALAAFLVVAAEHSYWGMGSGWGVDSFPWYPEFDRPLGKPLGDAESRVAGQYFRAFQHLNVTLDTGKRTATVAWHGLGPVPGPPPPPPAPPVPHPPAPHIGHYSGVGGEIIHQNPPSFDQTKTIACTNQTLVGCAFEAAAACDNLMACLSFSVISPQYQHTVWAELGPNTLGSGQPNKWWTTWGKSDATPGQWTPCPKGKCTPINTVPATATATATDDRDDTGVLL